MQDTFARARNLPKGLYARYLCSRDALSLKPARPSARATIGYLVYNLKAYATTKTSASAAIGYLVYSPYINVKYHTEAAIINAPYVHSMYLQYGIVN